MKIEEKFLTELALFYQEKHKVALRKFYNQKESVPRHIRMKAEMVIHRLADVDREVQRTVDSLKKLPYLSFGVRSNSDRKSFFTGLTDEIYVMYRRNSNWHYDYLGKYVVAIPYYSMLNVNLNNFHFVPVNNLHAISRHFHHTGRNFNNDKNPLDWDDSTCWGSAGAMIINALEIADVASVFESCYIFLQKVDWDDRLTDMSWQRGVTPRTYMQVMKISEMELVDRQNPDALIFVRS